MRIFFCVLAFAGVFVNVGYAADEFTAENGLKISLEHKAPSKKGNFNALAIVTSDSGEAQFPCATNGSFLKKAEKSYTGSYRASCELLKFSRDKSKYDLIRLAINAKFSGEALGGSLKKTYEVTAERENEDGLNRLNKEWKVLGDGEFTAAATAKLGRVAADSPFKLLALIESGLLPHVGKIAYAQEVERNVMTWGFNYFVKPSYEVDLDGRWGRSGAKYTIQDSFWALEKEGDISHFIFAGKAALTERSGEILPSLDAEEDSDE